MHFTSSLLQLRMSEFAKKSSQILLLLVLLLLLLLTGNLFAQKPIASNPLHANAIGVRGNGLNGTTLDDLSTIAYHYPALQIDGNRADMIKISDNFSYTSCSIILNTRVKSFTHFKYTFDKFTSEF